MASLQSLLAFPLLSPTSSQLSALQHILAYSAAPLCKREEFVLNASDFLDIHFCAKAEITEPGRSRQSAKAFREKQFGRSNFQKDKEKRRQDKLNFAENRWDFYSIWTLNQRLPSYPEH